MPPKKVIQKNNKKKRSYLSYLNPFYRVEEEEEEEVEIWDHPPAPYYAVDESRELALRRAQNRPQNNNNNTPRNSNYFVTVNTHIRRDDVTPEEARYIADILQRTFNQALRENTGRWVRIVPGNENMTAEQMLEAIEVYTKPEIQPNNNAHQIHSHSIIAIRHNSKVQVDYNEIRNLVNNIVAPEVIRYVRNHAANVPKAVAGGQFKTDIDRASGSTAGEEFEYLDEEGVSWDSDYVGEYYGNLKDSGYEGGDAYKKYSRRRLYSQ